MSVESQQKLAPWLLLMLVVECAIVGALLYGIYTLGAWLISLI